MLAIDVYGGLNLGYKSCNAYRPTPMLSFISISNFTIVESLEMDFHSGMTVITGETGAGKSIMLDALGLCLGDRADPKSIRPGAERADIHASFDIADIHAAQAWLAERELLAGDECLLRRVITREGRSRAYINGNPATLQDCKALGEHLIDIHSQHAHQSLLRKSVQRSLLDEFAGKQALATRVEQAASDWLRAQHELNALIAARDEQSSRAQLLNYQAQELDELALGENELLALEQEQKRLVNAEDVLRAAHEALTLTEAQAAGARQAFQLLQGDGHAGKTVENAWELLDSAAIQLSEAHSEVQAYIDSVSVDPARLAEVEKRLEQIYDVARKHRVMPEQLPQQYADLSAELATLSGGDERIAELTEQAAQWLAQYRKDAAMLTKERGKAARRLQKAAAELLASLSMAQCTLTIDLPPRGGEDPHPQGQEDINFLISTNPGAEPQPLGKIASGGELSRISLAIQVVTANTGTVPSMVFDEVDVGIGGGVAEVVGRLLRQLAGDAQVLCVTHLPQVAAQGHQHLQVAKEGDKKSVRTQLSALDADGRIEEIARMLGGITITQQTRAHAEEMLSAING